MGKRGPRPRYLIDVTWRPELAYVVGLLTADGCLYNDGHHLNLVSKDIDQLENFLSVIGEHWKIARKKDYRSERIYYHVQVGNVPFYEFLTKIGLFPNKSKTLGAIQVPLDFYFHFLRGLFDGDGCTYSY